MTSSTKFLRDYRPSAFSIDGLELDFDLGPARTLVRARLIITRIDDSDDLVLDGEALKLHAVRIDGKTLTADRYVVGPTSLMIFKPEKHFELETLVEIDPSANASLMGLYMSGGRFCTQCESEGFRRITYSLDRPDVLTRYTVRMVADKERYPTLLSNGDLIDSGDLDNGRHFAVWHDPHPKPSYLFALVAGEFETVRDTFRTMSGQTVDLSVHVDPGNANRAPFALDALKRAMKWDEDVFKREYDLSQFHIVAVRDFNYGAMENKSLNVFNASAVLANSATETDDDFARVEQVVAHEYFHNWTGNRITLRDWFQLCLKEGLTVYRDQEFQADQNSRALQRINDVEYLRAHQLPEDTGPFAHPVRPDRFEKIDNFYTSTVYRKGAALVRVLSHILGAELFAAGMQRYFDSFDGQAVTIEDFVSSFEAVSGRDLSDFLQWYLQAGTPVVTTELNFDQDEKTVTLTVSQSTSSTPGQPEKRALPIPLRVGFIDVEGRVLSAQLDGRTADEHGLLLGNAETAWKFTDVQRRPIPAVFRGAPAPVELRDGLDDSERLLQMRFDPDSFTRWDAGRRLMTEHVIATSRGAAALAAHEIAQALHEEATGADIDPALTARLLTLPTLGELIQAADRPDPDALDDALKGLRLVTSEALNDLLVLAATHPETDEESRAPRAIGRRALQGVALRLLAAQGERHAIFIGDLFSQARSMTTQLAALGALGAIGGATFARALERFEAKWHNEALVMDKWFAVQARSTRDGAIEVIHALARHPLFNLRNPNRARALYGVFATGNLRLFHAADGSGYRLLGEVILATDSFNPLLASRFTRAFDSWKRFDETRQREAATVLKNLSAADLSPVQRELVDKLL